MHAKDDAGIRQVPEGSGELGKVEKTGCKIICGAPTTLAVKGFMMMMMIINEILICIVVTRQQLLFVAPDTY